MRKKQEMTKAPEPTAPTYPAFCSIRKWTEISGMSRSVTYVRLAAGDLRGVKSGSKTLVDVEFGLGFMRALPPVLVGK